MILSRGNSKIGRMWNVSLAPELSCNPFMPCYNNGCYAQKFMKMYKGVRERWTRNALLANENSIKFFDEIRKEIEQSKKKLPYFRFHVGGDCPSLTYLIEALNLARDHPEISFYLPTKRYTWASWMAHGAPKNMVLAISAWPGLKLPQDNTLPVAWMQDGAENRVPPGTHICEGGCEECGYYCWKMDQGDSVVFLKHR